VRKSAFYRKFLRPIKHVLGYWLLLAIVFFVRIKPRGIVLCLARLLGKFVFRVSKKDREIALENLAIAFPEISETERIATARMCFANTMMNFADMLRVKSLMKKRPPIWRIEGEEHLREVQSRYGGGIVITGHIGPFELIAPIWKSLGVNVAVVGRRLYDERIDRLLVKQRQKTGVENIPSDSHPRRVLSMIRSGYLIGTLIDTHTKSVDGLPAPFFGREVRTISAPAGLARISGTPLLPMAIFREGKAGFLLKVWAPIEVERTSDRDADIRELLRRGNEAIEAMIRFRPEQWIWFHDRFRNS